MSVKTGVNPDITYKDDVLRLLVDVEDESYVALLNSDSETQDIVKRFLKEVARYEGDFVLEWDIPF